MRILAICFFLACLLPNCFCQEIYNVQTKNIIAPVSPALWGLFFEDINRGADGGLYAEMVENRSFDFPDPKYISVTTNASDTVGLMNGSFHGMAFKKNLGYHLTLRYRQLAPGIHMRALLFGADNNILANISIELKNSQDWIEQIETIVPSDSSTQGKLLVVFEGTGKLDLDCVSLFPTNTWKGRPGGLRYDLVQKLADLHPGFLRFPGGCIVEGDQLVNRYQWKHTIGDLQDRWLTRNIWNDNIPDRQTPDYFQSFGLGFYEYFQLCEDIGASPLPIINCGMSCQFNEAEVVSIKDLQPFIQDALDLVEFANGDISTTWGAKRAKLGHPASFNMKMLGVGNENWGPQYAERLALFTKAIKEKYPNIKLINATGYSMNATIFHYMDSVLRKNNADIIDEHFYSLPEWFLNNTTRYDNYDRKGPKIFVGEYSAQSDHVGSKKNVNNLKTALSEAAFMTGIERNAAVVTMASYAPLFADVKDWQWTPNLIWFDNSRSYSTPNYYVQQLFSINKGTDAVPLLLNGNSITGQDSVWASAVIDRNAHEIIIKLVNMSAAQKQKTVMSDTKTGSNIKVTSLSDSNPGVVNSLDTPNAIAPGETTFVSKSKSVLINLKPYSLTIVKIPLQ